TKPKETGIIRYTLSCENGEDTVTKHLLVVIQEFKWFETIPIINLRVPGSLQASVFSLIDAIKQIVFRPSLVK
ncbi:MAG: hypothetical protein AB1721_02325, partial [Patescibacteria group bacterium]